MTSSRFALRKNQGYNWDKSWEINLPQVGFSFYPAMTLEEARKLLGLGQHASRQEIRSAYRREARRWHPDLALDPKAEAEYRQHMQQVNVAYQKILQFIEEYRFELVENSSPEDLMQWWRNRFATGSWSPPTSDNSGENKD